MRDLLLIRRLVSLVPGLVLVESSVHILYSEVKIYRWGY